MLPYLFRVREIVLSRDLPLLTVYSVEREREIERVRERGREGERVNERGATSQLGLVVPYSCLISP